MLCFLTSERVLGKPFANQNPAFGVCSTQMLVEKYNIDKIDIVDLVKKSLFLEAKIGKNKLTKNSSGGQTHLRSPEVKIFEYCFPWIDFINKLFHTLCRSFGPCGQFLRSFLCSKILA